MRAVLPSGKVLNYAYNANGQVAQISLNGAALITGITYQAFGPASGWSALGQAHRRSFNLDGHVTGITTPDLNITMGYDQAERLSTLQEGKLGLQRFGYAGNGWLDRYTFTDGITGRYDFDPSGNRTAQRDGVKGTVTSMIAGNSNQVTSVTKNNGKTVPMRHDLAGNLTFDGVQDVELSYDGANRASGVKNKGTQYRYNHADQRVEKLGPGTRGVGKEIYAYDLSGLMGGVYGPDAKPLWETVRLDGAPVAVLGGDNKAYAAHPDYRGAPIRLNGANGAMVWDWQASGPWADVSPLHYTPGLSAAFPFHYRERLPGQFYDDETDMNYNGARIYNMHLGRFNQPDPVLQLDGLGSYNIDNNNPVGFVDPDGRQAQAVLPLCVAQPYLCVAMGIGTGITIAASPQGQQAISDAWHYVKDQCTSLAGQGIRPPGDCEPGRYRDLKQQVDSSCKPSPKICRSGDACTSMEEKIAFFSDCAAARKQIMDECFHGGDVAHIKEYARVDNYASGCRNLLPTCTP
ncbi:MAG: hypothetical protein IPI58_08750 [Alphaproteobacteria bacterium]|nr:MAG: hypothetical protein IPI58_08750 [Alphaproteobacteria bacterium]